MGLRFRKSVKLGKGVRLNLNKKSVGLTVGGKGFKTTINTKGKRTTSVGIPGTGLSYTHSSGGGKKTTTKKTTTTTQPTTKPPMKTGVMPLIITVCFGWLGLHWFISGRAGMGFLYLLTFGVFGIGWIYDIVIQIIAIVKGQE